MTARKLSIVVVAAGAAFLVTGTVAVMMLRRRYVTVRVEGPSMEPTLRAGRWVLVQRTRIDQVRRGQVVVLAFPRPAHLAADNPKWMIKRVTAVPGDPVPRSQVPALRNVTDAHVPPGQLVLLGDNSPHSYDSRRAGYFAADRLLGVVVRTMEL
jgi:signal peptidase I